MAAKKSDYDDLKAKASETLRGEKDVRPGIEGLTLSAFSKFGMDPEQMKQTIKSITEGISEGVERYRGEITPALKQAMAGLDDALAKSALATKLAMEQMRAQSKEFIDRDFSPALENLKKMEGNFLDTWKEVANDAGVKVKEAMHDVAQHAQRAGTDAGAAALKAMSEFGASMSRTVSEATTRNVDTARDMGARFAQLASDRLAEMAKSLQSKSGRDK